MFLKLGKKYLLVGPFRTNRFRGGGGSMLSLLIIIFFKDKATNCLLN
jgi:hypothetical protein